MERKLPRIKLIALLALAFALSAAIAIGAFRFAASAMYSLRDGIIAGIQSDLSKNLSYGSIDPFFINSMTINDIELKNSDGKLLAKADRLSLKFNLFNYLFMNENILRGITLVDGFLNFNQEECADIVAQIAGSMSSSERVIMPRQTKSFYFKGKNLGANFLLEGGNVNIDRCSADVLIRSSRCKVGGKLELSGKNLSNPIVREFSSRISFDSDSSLKEDKGVINLRMSNFTSDLLQIKKHSFVATFDSDNFVVRNAEGVLPVDCFVQFDRKSGALTASGIFQDLRLSDLVQFTKKYRYLDDYARMKATGSFNIICNSADTAEKFSYNVDVSARCDGEGIPLNPRCQISFTGVDSYIDVGNLSIQTDRGGASYVGTLDCRLLALKGSLLLDGIKAASDVEIDSLYSVLLSDRQLNMDSESLKVNGISLGCNSISVGLDSGAYSFELPSLALTGTMKKGGETSGVLRLSEYPIKNLETVLLGADSSFSENLFADADVYFIRNSSNFYFTGRDICVRDAVRNEKLMDFSVTSTLDDLKVSDIAFNCNGIAGKGYFDIADMRTDFCTFETFWNVNGIDYDFNGFLNKGRNLFMRGSYGFILTAFFDKAGWPFDARAAGLPLFVNGGKSNVDMNISGQFADGSLQMLSINSLKMSHLNFLKGSGNEIGISGTLSGSNLKISSWTLTDTYSTVKGSGEATFASLDDCQGWIRGTGSNLNEEYNVYARVSDGKLDVDANCRNSKLERFTSMQATGNLNASAKIAGTIDNPVIDADVEVEYGTLLDRAFEIRMAAQLSKERSEIKSALGKYGSLDIVSASAYVDWNAMQYRLETDMLLNDSEKGNDRIALEIDGAIQESGQWIINPATCKNTGIVELSASRAVLLGYDSWNLDFSNSGDRLCVIGGPFKECIKCYYYPKDGTFDMDLEQPLFISGKISGSHKGTYVDALMTDISVDVGKIGQLTRYDFFFPLSGTGRGVVRVSGNIGNPEFWGVVNVSDLYFSIYSLPDILGPVPASIYFQGNDITMPPVVIDSFDNQIYVDCAFMLESWYLEYFKVNVSAYGNQKHGLRIRDSFSGVDVDGCALGNFSISGMGDVIELEGDITINDCIINLSQQNASTDEFDPATEFVVNLKLHSGTGVEFFWPTKQVPVLRAFAAKDQNIDVEYDSASNIFALKGSVDFKGGDIFYFSNNFFIKEGKIVFNENQDKFDPTITVDAELRTATRSNNRVKLMLLMDNTPLSRFQPRVESVPALSQSELYEIMGDALRGGQVSDEESNTMASLVSAGSYGTQLIGILRPVERSVKDFLNLDVFSIRAQLSDKIFNNRRNEEKNRVDIKSIASSTVFRNIDAFMGKSFGKYFFLDGTLRFSTWDFDTFEYYEYNMPNFFNMYLESEINLEADTPLFTLNLGLYPRFGNISDSILDTTIGLSWRFTF